MTCIFRLLLFFVCSTLSAGALLDWNDDGTTYSPRRIKLGYSAGKWIGIEQGYFETGLFLPYAADQGYILLLDGSAYRFNDSKWGASVGVGLRIPAPCNHLFGLNVYEDYLEGHVRKSFNRIGFGVEWLGACWDLRLNTYFAVNNETRHTKKSHYRYKADYFATCQKTEFSILQGFDAEIAGSLGCWCSFNFYGAIGPYYFSNRDLHSFWGGQARLEMDWKSLIYLQVRTSYDKIYHSHTQAQIQLRIPFGKGSCDCTDWNLQPIQRNGVIFTKKCCNYKWNW